MNLQFYQRARRRAALLALLYIVLALLWNVAGDALLTRYAYGQPLPLAHIVLGASLVIATGLLLYWLMLRAFLYFGNWRSEAAINEKRLRLALDGAAGGIWDLDLRSGRLYLSSHLEEMLSCVPGERAQRCWLDAVHPQDREAQRAAMTDHLANRAPRLEHVSRVRQPDGSYRWMLTRGLALRSPKGAAYRVIGVVIDLDDRRQAELEVERSAEEMRTLSLGLQSLVEEERRRIARELHDELGQLLTGLKLDLDWLQGQRGLPSTVQAKLAAMTGTTDATVSAVRRIAANLRPALLDDLGLAAACEWLVEDFAKRTGMRAAIEIPEDLPEPVEQVANAAFRILQEALTNIARHARASSVRVRLEGRQHELHLCVEDDGQGLAGGRGRLGLLGMRERAELLGGRCEVRSRTDGGTFLCAHLPVRAPAHPSSLSDVSDAL